MNAASDTLVQLDFTKVDQIGDTLLDELNVLRERAPIIWSDSAGAWIVTRHADVMLGFSGTLPLSTHRFEARCFNSIPQIEREGRIPIILRTVPTWIVNCDPPQHTRLRKLMTRAFGKKVVEDLRPFARATIRKVLDEVPENSQVEFVNDVARAITGRVIMRMLGVPESHLGRLKKWSLDLNTAFGSAQPSAETLESAESSLDEMTQLFRAEIELRRKCPNEDFLSQLVRAHDGDDALSEEELMGICYITLISGHDTTMNSMSLGLVSLANDQSARQFLLEHPERITDSVMEVMRYSSMSTAQPRIVSADFEWHGHKMRKGEVVFLMVASANRDPRVFSDPNTLDMHRSQESSTIFGPGLHHCIGHLLAKMQLTEVFPEICRRFEKIEILDKRLEFTKVLAFRGLESLHVRFCRRASAAIAQAAC